jgi:hypothetical protein
MPSWREKIFCRHSLNELAERLGELKHIILSKNTRFPVDGDRRTVTKVAAGQGYFARKISGPIVKIV